MNRLIIRQYIWKNKRPRARSPLTTLGAYDIVQHYNSVIRGLIHYYGPWY